MLKRVYIDNFRCLVNFTLPLGQTALLLGLNGSGKTTVFEVLNILQKFISGGARVDDVFSEQTRARWDKRLLQTFELEVEGPPGTYAYKLMIEHNDRLKKARVKTETLSLNGKPLFFFDEEGMAHLFRDDFSEGPRYPFDWSQSGLSTLLPRPENTQLTWFKDHLRKYIIVSLRPGQMKAETRDENDYLLPGAENFSSWYQYFSQAHQIFISTLFSKLSKVLPKFRQLQLKPYGEQHLLQAEFLRNSDEGPTHNHSIETSHGYSGYSGKSGGPIPYSFNELSDGERALIVLYSLLFAAKEASYTLFLDEPENYVGLSELQPWLMELEDVGIDSEIQAVIISHHPELIDYLGPESGILLTRQEGGPTRIGKLPDMKDAVLNLSEVIARGWEDNG